ncbi:hypothetical protein F3K40_22215 [Streptomyces sp. LBUM 1478]|nr:hypothetical protein [Streptomyces sp. LBUM 1478]
MFGGCGSVVAGRAHAAEPHMSQPRAPGRPCGPIRERCRVPRGCGGGGVRDNGACDSDRDHRWRTRRL